MVQFYLNVSHCNAYRSACTKGWKNEEQPLLCCFMLYDTLFTLEKKMHALECND